MFLTPWEEYVLNKDLPRMQYLCQCADRMIAEFVYNYNYSAPIPKIYIDASDSFYPCSAPDGKIILPHGFFQWLENLVESLPDQITPEIKKKNAGLMMMFWVVAHEYSHLARSHFELKKVRPDLYDACEYDADMCATEGLFRHTQHILDSRKSGVTTINNKIYLLVSVFFYLRPLIDRDKLEYEKHHKPFHIRLWWILEKLAWIDNFDPVTAQPTEAFVSEIKILMDALYSAEKAYIKHNQIENSLFIDLFVRFADTVKPYADEISKKWQEAAPFVKQFQLIKIST
ncbi:hypothetical protein [Methylophilus sp. 3sh_L]|uniref:hypothetical protein n=1 Tax=Methylophilus sp. 3sh_L TaxID=3377114 RepID=UPI00398EAE89